MSENSLIAILGFVAIMGVMSLVFYESWSKHQVTIKMAEEGYEQVVDGHNILWKKPVK